MTERWPCPCCGHLTLDEGPGDYELCPVCGWEDDGGQLRWPLSSDGANGISLVEAQVTYARTGAAHEDSSRVRPARDDEPLDPGFRPLDLDRDWFESNPPSSYQPRWPADLQRLYWWRPTYWEGRVELPDISYDRADPGHRLVLNLREQVPEVTALVDRVESTYGEPAPFVVCSLLRDVVVDHYLSGETEVADRIVGVLDAALVDDRSGPVRNAILIGFLEEGWLDDVVEQWPPTIRRLALDQATHRARAEQRLRAEFRRHRWRHPWRALKHRFSGAPHHYAG